MDLIAKLDVNEINELKAAYHALHGECLILTNIEFSMNNEQFNKLEKVDVKMKAVLKWY